MEAMVAAAQQDSRNVMEFYAIQVVVIQHKMRDYAGEVETIDGV